jgi:uncharacterized protein (DUF2062 family)
LHRAPHKPVLLLAVLELVASTYIAENTIKPMRSTGSVPTLMECRHASRQAGRQALASGVALGVFIAVPFGLGLIETVLGWAILSSTTHAAIRRIGRGVEAPLRHRLPAG